MTILALDGSHVLWRAKSISKKLYYEKFFNLIKHEGKDEEEARNSCLTIVSWQSMVWHFFRMLVPKVEEFAPERVYVLWDLGRCKYRVNLFEEYKLERVLDNPTSLDIYADHQFKLAKTYINNNFPKIGFASILIPGIEADDIAYYLSHTYPSGTLVSDDKDWFLNLNANWKLCRSMQDKEGKKYLFDWKDFTTQMNCDNTSVSPRDVYLFEKALVGDKDEIPRITTPAVARKIANYMSGLSTKITEKEKLIISSNEKNINRNIQLAETNWLIAYPNLVDMRKFMEYVHNKVDVSFANFLQIAGELKLVSYIERWNLISRNLKYEKSN